MYPAARFLVRFSSTPVQPALALGDDHSAVTAIGNYFGYVEVFSHQVAGLARPADLPCGLSTSGGLPNVAAVLTAAGDAGLIIVMRTAAQPGTIGQAAGVVTFVPSDAASRIQKAHRLLGHGIYTAVEQAMVACDHAPMALSA